jgi:hypothetical protein
LSQEDYWSASILTTSKAANSDPSVIFAVSRIGRSVSYHSVVTCEPERHASTIPQPRICHLHAAPLGSREVVIVIATEGIRFNRHYGNRYPGLRVNITVAIELTDE